MPVTLANHPGVMGPVVRPFTGQQVSVAGPYGWPQAIRPGVTWRRRFQHRQAPAGAPPSLPPTSGPTLYPMQTPAGARGRMPGPVLTGRIASSPGHIPLTGSVITAPPIRPGVTWLRQFQHRQIPPMVNSPQVPFIPPPRGSRNPLWGPVDKVSRTGDSMTGRLASSTAITAGVQVLTDQPLISVDASKGLHFRVTLGGNRTLGSPVNGADGQKITFEIIQDGTGGRTLALGPAYAGTGALTLTATPGKRDFFGWVYNATTGLWYPAGFAQGF